MSYASASSGIPWLRVASRSSAGVMCSDCSTAMGRLYARVVVRWRILLLLVVIAGCGGGEKATGPAPDAPPGIELTSSAFDGRRRDPEALHVRRRGHLAAARVDDVAEQRRSRSRCWSRTPMRPVGRTCTGPSTGSRRGHRRSQRGQAAGRGPTEGENSFGDDGYGGPCPPEGDKAAPLRRSRSTRCAPTPQLERRARSRTTCARRSPKHAIARGRLVGTFKRG